MKSRYADLEETIGYRFRSREGVRAAMTHPSFAAEHNGCREDYQRLEFLGDAVIELATSNWLYERYPDAPEGKLTKLRATIARRETLAELARHIGLDHHVRLGRGEIENGGYTRPSILCDAFEALIGAVFVDAGKDLQTAAEVFLRLIHDVCPDVEARMTTENPKGALQELVQQEYGRRPDYETVETSGPEHSRQFAVEVSVNDEVVGRGEGARQRDAQQEAARQALHNRTAKEGSA